jgi:diguanylate cyclase (GGDEF)-like protein
MSENMEHQVADELTRWFLDILRCQEPPQIPEKYAAVDSLQVVRAYLIDLRAFLFAASNGDLSRKISLDGFAGGCLKSLQANLRHMTWQTKMVAGGDFSQRAEFMGEYSESFNSMVAKLDRTMEELVAKKTELSQANQELRKEIAIRQETEAALRKSREKLRQLAMTDSLTGLFNRRHFNRMALKEIDRALRYSRPLSVIVMDLDHFKKVNDLFGHGTGDRVLVLVGDILREILRSTEISARYGGEEFIVLLPETSAVPAADVAERLRLRIEGRVLEVPRGSINVTASFGVSDALDRSAPMTGSQRLSELISSADRAMYSSKESGRNQVTVFRNTAP